MRDPFKRDLILIHPPMVYDFRKRTSFLGPIADAVPSTGEFEMYPIGMTSIASFLEENHYNVQIINLAYRMLKSARFDPERYLKSQHATVFGIDLHWLPHAQGSLAVAEQIKTLHPEAKVLFGGLSSSYFFDELIRYPYVDFVVRGDSTEEPVRQLLSALREGRPLDGVENLSFKDADGSVRHNPLSFVPDDLNYVDVPDYRYAMRSVFKYGNLDNLIPYLQWLRYPTTMLLNSRGCTQNCAICGGSLDAYRQLCSRARPAFRSVDKLIDDVRAIKSFSRAPIFMVHDPRIGGVRRGEEFLGKLKKERISNELVIELFFPASDAFFAQVQAAAPAWSMEITLESPLEQLRKRNGKFGYSNAKVEETIRSALAHGCRKLDLFFMVGIPHQSYQDALLTVDYYRELLKEFDGDPRIRAYVSPLGPFLDPGSRAYERAEYGYKVVNRNLEDYRRAMLEPSWKDALSFETDQMSREQISLASYAVGEGLNELKYQYRIIDRNTYLGVKKRLSTAHMVLSELDHGRELPEEALEALLLRLHKAIQEANQGSLFGGDELKWPISQRFHVGFTLFRALLGGLTQELRHTVARLAGVYDTHPFSGQRSQPYLSGPGGRLSFTIEGRLHEEPAQAHKELTQTLPEPATRGIR